MIESCGPGTSTGWPASAECSPHAADERFDDDDRSRDRRSAPTAAASERAHAHRHDDDIGRRAASCSSTSAKIVA